MNGKVIRIEPGEGSTSYIESNSNTSSETQGGPIEIIDMEPAGNSKTLIERFEFRRNSIKRKSIEHK